MADFSVDFLGCKISHTDAEQVREALLAAGHSESKAAQVRVVNTCCITAEAEAKSRKKVRGLLASGDDVQVFVTGCGATLRPGTYDDLGERVTALPGAASLAVPAIVAAADRLGALGCKGEVSPDARIHRSRAFVKIQDGCDFLCSYCIVPTVRGRSRSRSTDAILRDVQRRVQQGRREIVLTGVNIGLFRDEESRISLPGLLHRVADVEGVARVRISSIEVNHVNKRLVAAMAAHPRVCHHLHVPMQSGDDGVLAAMRRNYRSAGYLRAIDRARSAMPDLNLSTDIIVGYPSEDDAAFTSTLEVAQRAGFTKVHAFPFSPRPGTEAEADADPVPAAVKRERSHALREAAHARAVELWRGKVGSRDEVVVERRASGAHAGYTRDYCPVSFEATGDLEGREGALVPVELVAAGEDGLVARIIAA